MSTSSLAQPSRVTTVSASARAKPACRSCARTKAVITRRAMPVSIARSGGSSNSGSVGSPGDADAIRSALSSRRGHRGAVLADPGPLGHDPSQLARHELRPLVAQEREADALAPDAGKLHVREDERLL